MVLMNMLMKDTPVSVNYLDILYGRHADNVQYEDILNVCF